MLINGVEYKYFSGAFNDESFASRIVGRKGASPIATGRSKVTTLDTVMEVIEDGDTISYPHYYRLGDNGLKMVVDKLREHKKRDIKLYANAIFDNCDPWLFEAWKDGIITGVYGNVYRKFGEHVTSGELLSWVGVGFSHGNRVRKLQTGEVHVKVAFGPVPIADVYGNSNGVMGKEEHWCGPLGLFSADAEFADYTCLLAGTVSEYMILPNEIPMAQVDFVVPVENPGLAEGIGSGTLDLERIRANEFNRVIADNVTNVMRAAGCVKDNFGFQVGSGAGLIVLDEIRKMLKEQKIVANFSIGGVTSMHVDMFNEGTMRYLWHGQLFEPSPKVIKSLLEDAGHKAIPTGEYASVANKECLVNMLDVAVLSALEVDVNFNVNTVCANGRIIGGIGGGQDVAAGADLTIMFLPLAQGKNGKGFAKVVDKVYTRTTPGEVVDVVVTEEFVSVNPQSKSTYKDAILNNARDFGLNIVTIEDLYLRSIDKARGFGNIPPVAETTDEIVHAIEWRDGTLLDVIKKTVNK